MHPKSLDGLLVVALEQAVAAPYTSRLLAESGARVIKIERPEGDFARHYDSIVHGESAYFVWLNSGKESLVLDVKADDDAALLKRILARADVFIQNLRPGAVDRLGLGYEDVNALNPQIVMCSISGYGLSGEYAQMKAYDALIQAETGLCSVTGQPHQPSKVGASICDISTGLSAYAEILKALYARAGNGGGRHVCVSLFEVMAEWMNVPLAYYKYGGRMLTGTGMDHAQVAPYGAFETKDGKIFIVVQNHREWVSLCKEVLDRPDLIDDDRFGANEIRTQNKDLLRIEIEQHFKRYTRAELASQLESAGVAFGSINELDDVWDHPALVTKAVRVSDEDAIFTRRVGDETAAPAEVPKLGAHSEMIRQEFG
ncbi:MAG: CaiB/BaiF CoA-transferase family protein [Pseudomonadota bacterium]